jgi:hypothetical protein
LKPNKKSKKKSRKGGLILAFAAIVVLGAGTWWMLRPGAAGSGSSLAAERPYTLDPGGFINDAKAQAAYQVAKDIPEVLEQLPCFCGCMAHFGHKNNLFCFSDTHGAGCDICENIALDARDMHKQGIPTEKIKQTIIDRYSHGE